MTSIYSHPQYHQAPLDQPTPQSPLFMSRDHAGTNNSDMMDQSQAHMFDSSPIGSFMNSSKQPQATANTIPTPTSSTAGTVPPTTGMDGFDDMMDIVDESGRRVKRRGSISAEDVHDMFRENAKRSKSVESPSDEQLPGAMANMSMTDFLQNQDPHPLILFCRRSYQPMYPDVTTNVLPLYGLNSIAKSVERFDPETGVKKKLRKSYKGKILDLPGKNEIPKPRPPAEVDQWGFAIEEKPEEPIENRTLNLLEMLEIPDDSWHNFKVSGRDLHKPLSQDALRRAMTMAPGTIPGFDMSVLGLEDKRPTPAPTTKSTSVAPQGSLTNGATPGGNVSSASVSPSLMDSRPLRDSRKKKRRYDEPSFEGYGEGYDDDDDAYGEDGAKKKKKRKKMLPGQTGTPTATGAVNITR